MTDDERRLRLITSVDVALGGYFDEMREVASELARHCSCCSLCQSTPCDGVLEGGTCDCMPCLCELEDDEHG